MNFIGPSTDGDYTIFQWRQSGNSDPPTIYLRDPSEPLPSQSSYRNPSFYLFHPDYTVPAQPSPQHSTHSPRGKKKANAPNDAVPKHKKEFENFHTSNGVRTIVGTIGPVQNGAWAAGSSFRNILLSHRIQCACYSRMGTAMSTCPESLP